MSLRPYQVLVLVDGEEKEYTISETNWVRAATSIISTFFGELQTSAKIEITPSPDTSSIVIKLQ